LSEAIKSLKQEHATEIADLQKSHANEVTKITEKFQVDYLPKSKLAEKLSEATRVQHSLLVTQLNKLLAEVYGLPILA
jgi:ABC-type transporter MlaC component